MNEKQIKELFKKELNRFLIGAIISGIIGVAIGIIIVFFIF